MKKSTPKIDLFSNPQKGEMGKIGGLVFLPISREKGVFGRIIWGLASGASGLVLHLLEPLIFSKTGGLFVQYQAGNTTRG